MIAAKTKYFKIKNPETGEFDSLIFIKSDVGYLIGDPDQIADVLGDSKELVPSQKVFSDEVLAIYEELKTMSTVLVNNQYIGPWAAANYNGVSLLERVQELERKVQDLELRLN